MRSQSECLSHDPVGQLTPVWLLLRITK